MPGDQDDLLRPVVFEAGPLSHVSAEDARLTSPRTVIRDLPAEMVERTRAIICTKRNTIGSARLRQDGSIDYSETVGGDGTVTAGSALGAEMLMARKCEVSQGHMTLPLEGRPFAAPSTGSAGSSAGDPPNLPPQSGRQPRRLVFLTAVRHSYTISRTTTPLPLATSSPW